MNKRLLFLLISFSFLSFQIKSQEKRYLAAQFLNWNMDNSLHLRTIEESFKNGINAVELSIPWTTVYPKYNSQPNWKMFDEQIEKTVSLGGKVALRIVFSRTWQNVEGFWEIEKGSMRDHREHYQREYWNTTSFSYTHRPGVDKAKLFIKEVLERYKSYQQQGKIVFVTIVNTPTQELGYHYSNDWAGKDDKFIGTYPALFDYNKELEDKYRIWLKNKYKDVFLYNFWNQTTYPSFEKIGPVVNQSDINFSYFGNAGKDTYIFKHLALKQFIDEVVVLIKSIDPSYIYVNSFGSVLDRLSHLRGTLAFKDLCEKTDGLKINDDIAYNHSFTMDVIRETLKNKLILNEAFFPIARKNATVNKEMELMLDKHYEHGSFFNSIVLESPDDVKEFSGAIQRLTSKWLATPYKKVVTEVRGSYKLSKAIDLNYYEDHIYKSWQAVQQKNPGKMIGIELEEDILIDNNNFKPQINNENDGGSVPNFDPNKDNPPNNGGNVGTGTGTGTGTGNGNGIGTGSGTGGNDPVVVVQNIKPVPRYGTIVKTLIINKNFTVLLPPDLFYDEDGYITIIQIIEKPKWVEFLNNQFMIGKTPIEVGKHFVKFRGIDNRGGTAISTIELNVERPKVRFDFIDANYFDEGIRYLASISDKKKLDVFEPNRKLNIIASCNIDSVSIDLKMEGAYSIALKSDYFPHSYFGDGGGFYPPVGGYKLTAEAFYKDRSVAKDTVEFSLHSSTQTTESWLVFPNPNNGVVNLKVPSGIEVGLDSFELLSSTGKSFKVKPTNFQKSEIISVDLSTFSSGVYFLRFDSSEGEKNFKLIRL